MDPGRAAMISTLPWLPRVSGDGPGWRLNTAHIKEVAPRERGWTLAARLAAPEFHGCPA